MIQIPKRITNSRIMAIHFLCQPRWDAFRFSDRPFRLMLILLAAWLERQTDYTVNKLKAPIRRCE